ncbi:hypothetical protein D3C80_1436960 [compost metagenome]
MIVGSPNLVGISMGKLRLNPLFYKANLVERRRDGGSDAMPGEPSFETHPTNRGVKGIFTDHFLWFVSVNQQIPCTARP